MTTAQSQRTIYLEELPEELHEPLRRHAAGKFVYVSTGTLPARAEAERRRVQVIELRAAKWTWRRISVEMGIDIRTAQRSAKRATEAGDD